MVLKKVKMAVGLLNIPLLTTLEYLTRQKNCRDQIEFSIICGDILELKYCKIV